MLNSKYKDKNSLALHRPVNVPTILLNGDSDLQEPPAKRAEDEKC